MVTADDKEFIASTLKLAERGKGKCSPNPMVGAVVVRSGRVVGEGFHRKAGTPHAEIHALRQAGTKARGATLYLSLEPCCHTGRTGPCTDAIIDAGIKRVVYASNDPDPRVNGKGGRILRYAGLKVTGGVLNKEQRQLNEFYFHSVRHKRPFVMVKMAQSLDGFIATSKGESKWISGLTARRYVHSLRAEIDAVVVGGETVRQDNPELTVRHVRGRNPWRIVISSTLLIPSESRLLMNNDDCKTILASTESTINTFSRRRHIGNIIFWEVMRNNKGLIDPEDFVRCAHEFGLRSLLIESGPKLAGAFISAGLVDKYVIITAPKILGDGRSSFDGIRSEKLSDAVQLKNQSVRMLGGDTLAVAYPVRSG